MRRNPKREISHFFFVVRSNETEIVMGSVSMCACVCVCAPESTSLCVHLFFSTHLNDNELGSQVSLF